MLANNALIVQTIFLEADTQDVVSVEHMEMLFDIPVEQVELILRYVTPFMTKAQKKCVDQKLTGVARLIDKPVPSWIYILRR